MIESLTKIAMSKPGVSTGSNYGELVKTSQSLKIGDTSVSGGISHVPTSSGEDKSNKKHRPRAREWNVRN